MESTCGIIENEVSNNTPIFLAFGEQEATERQLPLAVVRAGLEPETTGFQVQRPNPLDHAAALLIGSLSNDDGDGDGNENATRQ